MLIIIGLFICLGYRLNHGLMRPVTAITSSKPAPSVDKVPPKVVDKPDMSELGDEKALQRHWAAIRRCVSAGNYPAMGYGFSVICVKRDFVDRFSSDPGP